MDSFIPMHDTGIMFESPFLLSASPRAGGNSDVAASFFAQGFKNAGGEIVPVYLRDFPCLPCVACGACGRAAEKGMDIDLSPAGEHHMEMGCPLTLKDRSAPLLQRLFRARHICIVSPIYFYHFPAQFKGLLDRTQPLWELAKVRDSRVTSLPPRICQVILVAARERGEHLFGGSLRTLKYVLASINVRLAEPLLLYGLDEKDDLVGAPEAQQRIVEYGEEGVRLILNQ